MTQIHDFELDVHRHSDGSIDFDHYRARATALRGAALRDAAALRSTFKFVMILMVTIAGVVLVANSPAPVVAAACLHCTRSLVPVDEPPASTRIASFPRTSRAE
jgi:hypothetical protein